MLIWSAVIKEYCFWKNILCKQNKRGKALVVILKWRWKRRHLSGPTAHSESSYVWRYSKHPPPTRPRLFTLKRQYFNTSCVVRKKVINQSYCLTLRHLASKLTSSYWRLLKMEPERLDEFTNKLKETKKAIIEGQPKPSHLKILKPSDQSDWKMIKYFDQVCRI